MRYLDTAVGGPDHTVEQWLLAELKGARVFAAQTGYLTEHGLKLIQPRLTAILNEGGEVHLVTGAREDQVSPDDLAAVTALFEPHGRRATLLLVDGDEEQPLMHAKSYYIRRTDGSETALAGSANLTYSGLRANHESAIVLDTRVTPDAPCKEILAAIRAWADFDRPAQRVTEATLDQVAFDVWPVTRPKARLTGRPKLPPSWPLGELLNPALEEIEAIQIQGHDGALTGVPTGFTDLDELTNGLHPGQLVIIGGRPGLGKSVLCLDFARAAAIKNGMTTALFSLEMPRTDLTFRLLAAEARVPLQNIRTGRLTDDEWGRLARRIGEIAEAPLFINDFPHLTMRDLRAAALRMRERNDLRLLAVDYLQLMTSTSRRENRVQEISEISRGLKTLAMELEIPVVVVSQLNRASDLRADKRPTLADLRDSGQIEQDGDLVILLYREDAVEKESARAGEADFILAKHRNGPTGTVTVAFQGHYSRFVDMAN
ncbi:DnaB-like helicase C-terminal domain-containing protein [Frankia sp. CiP3]|uniref:DnaB-like helicase C-terminal domain-containing protein n=1 Tax=Frankia sp. CiP3 TaxID=2880971 RepID=UPI001EF5ACFD|nr:DnaB-like helicase C-terminal domain-containing protein [Frankia sp. CiP3]